MLAARRTLRLAPLVRRLSSAAEAVSSAAEVSEAQRRCFKAREYQAKLSACPDACKHTFSDQNLALFAAKVFEEARGSAAAAGSGDVSLSFEDYSKVLGKIRQSMPTTCTLTRMALENETDVLHFEKADVNNDGSISRDEFHAYLREIVLQSIHAHQIEADAQRMRECVSKCAISRTPLLEARVQQLVPGINEYGMHGNRVLLFGGARPDKDAVLMRSNDYLQLAGHAAIARAKAEALLHEAPGERRARVFTLDAPDRPRAFERRVAALLGAQDAVLTTSGAHAVRGLLETLSDRRTPIYADRLSWTVGSLRHGLGASVNAFPHNNMDHLRALAAEEPGVIVIDGVYGNGAVGNVRAAAEVARETGSVLVVDETHSFGCAAGGLGLVDELGVADGVHFRCIGLSKAFASRGGLVVGPSRALEAFRFVDRQVM